MAPSERQALDVHAHAMPMPLLRRLEKRGLADLGDLSRNIVRLDPQVSGVGPNAPLPLAPSQHEVPVRLEEMDKAGVTNHAVSMPPFLFCSTAEDGELVRDVIRNGNDGLAEYVSGAPDRLHALGSVALGWPGAAEEVVRCLDELGMSGIAIGTRGGGKELDDPVNADLWALLAERDVFAFMHPSGVPDGHRQRDFWMPQLVGYPMETALAVARMVYGGVIEKYDFALCLAHGGGCVPSLRGRMTMGWERKEVAHTTTATPAELLDRLYYDTAVFSTPILRRIIEDVGVGHVMLGTDHPFELADFTPVSTVLDLGLDDAATAAILWDNAAARIFRS